MKSSTTRHGKKGKPSGMLKYCVITSPVGRLLLAGDHEALSLLVFQDGKHPITPERSWTYDEKPFQKVIGQLTAYFEGRRKSFKLKLRQEGTSFQRKVWNQLQAIPYGRTASYGEIARSIRRPKASRAVGAANGQNPISIVVPCHRVIGSTGSLVGYGGGLKIKKALLALERRSGVQKP